MVSRDSSMFPPPRSTPPCLRASWMMSSMLPLLAASILFSLSRMDFSGAMSGATSSLVMRLTSSIARTLSGSAMARNSLFSSRETATILWLWANSRGSSSEMSNGIAMRARLMGGVLSTRPMDTAMSCSLTYAFSRINLNSRVPSFFCCCSKSSTWPALSRPSSTSASAIRSPHAFTGGGMRLPENLADVFDQFSRRDKIPQQPVGGGGRQFFCRLLIEWVGRGHENRFAHAIERQDAPALADGRGETPGQIHIHVVLIQWQKSNSGLV